MSYVIVKIFIELYADESKTDKPELRFEIKMRSKYIYKMPFHKMWFSLFLLRILFRLRMLGQMTKCNRVKIVCTKLCRYNSCVSFVFLQYIFHNIYFRRTNVPTLNANKYPEKHAVFCIYIFFILLCILRTVRFDKYGSENALAPLICACPDIIDKIKLYLSSCTAKNKNEYRLMCIVLLLYINLI